MRKLILLSLSVAQMFAMVISFPLSVAEVILNKKNTITHKTKKQSIERNYIYQLQNVKRRTLFYRCPH